MNLHRPALAGVIACWLLLWVTGTAIAASGTALLDLTRTGDRITITASLDGRTASATLDDSNGAVTKRSSRLYDMLEHYGRHADDKLATELRDLGNMVYGPFREIIDRSNTVAIRIPLSMTRFPFEFMLHGDKSLGLQKPVVVCIGRLPHRRVRFTDCESALVLADLTADPDQACAGVAELLDDATYRDLADTTRKYLENLRQHDILLVSAHGDVTFADEDCIDVGKIEVYPDSWARVAPTLAYFDSCQIGASIDFVKAFQAAGTHYLVAPITSNEAGNSSTNTIKFFFAEFMAGASPETAMFTTKNRLFAKYSQGTKISYGKLLYRVMPFRVYRLN